MALECYNCGGDGHMARECTADLAAFRVIPPRKCRVCGGTACRKDLCAQCGIPRAHHTQAGRTECAWRGQPCATCGQPPHPDWHIGRTASWPHPVERGVPGPERCERYAHPDDTPERRAIREATPWRRMADPATFYLKHA